MRTRSPVIYATLITALVLALAVIAVAADSFIGTWKLNVAKSKASDPSLIPKSEILKNVAQDNGIKTIFDGADAQGKATHSESSGTWDGKDLSVTGDPGSDMVALKRVDANTLEVVAKKAGKVVATYQSTVSKNGKTMTIAGKGKDAKGQEWSATTVYDKQ
jgi:hypothetical protein